MKTCVSTWLIAGPHTAGCRQCLAVLSVASACALMSPDAHAAPPIVIGQSLPLTGTGFTASNRVLQGTRAAIEAVNQAGGIGGRPIELVTLDDANDPALHAANMRRLVEHNKAVALLNCVGDALCSASAKVASETRTALIGPISGLPSLRSDGGFVFATRTDIVREVKALARQLKGLGVLSSVVMIDETTSDERIGVITQALRSEGIAATVVKTSHSRLAADLLRAKDAPALVVELGFDVTDALGRLSEAELQNAPKLLASLATPGLATLLKLFSGRIIGFTSVVPNPEVPNSALVQKFTGDADYGGTAALTFEGLEGYVNALVCIEALRRAGAQVNNRTVAETIPKLGRLDLGGFVLTFGRAGRSASDQVDLGLRTRDGRLLR
jgi:branched-chain amino acid transport system substrate-binding protein